MRISASSEALLRVSQASHSAARRTSEQSWCPEPAIMPTPPSSKRQVRLHRRRSRHRQAEPDEHLGHRPSQDAVLLTPHPRVGRRLYLGGRFEDDASVVEAALREAVEECGIPDLKLDPQPLHLAVHPVTCSLGVPTRHLDVRFVAVAPPGAAPAISAESLNLRWYPPGPAAPLTGVDVPEQVRRAFGRIG
jgi:8-oxo-dGTP pyrophosphatase MutT (NUDIX family)